MDKEPYKNMTTSKLTTSKMTTPQTPAVPLIGKGVAVLASVIISHPCTADFRYCNEYYQHSH